jgi:hypothetical protein
VRAIRDKLSGLAFLDPDIAPLVGSIDDVLAALPQVGPIDGASLAALRGVITLLTDAARMREHGRLLRERSARDAQRSDGPAAMLRTLAAPVREGEAPRREIAVGPGATRAPRADAFW